jgi:hypothetical protein
MSISRSSRYDSSIFIIVACCFWWNTMVVCSPTPDFNYRLGPFQRPNSTTPLNSSFTVESPSSSGTSSQITSSIATNDSPNDLKQHPKLEEAAERTLVTTPKSALKSPTFRTDRIHRSASKRSIPNRGIHSYTRHTVHVFIPRRQYWLKTMFIKFALARLLLSPEIKHHQCR